MDAINTLQQIIDSTKRIAALKTQETDRLLALFKRYSLTTGQAVYDWTSQSGLYRIGVEHIFIPRTRTPADVLAYIGASRHYGIYLLREFEPALTKPSIQSRLCSLCDIDDGIRRLVLLIGAYSHLPAALQDRITMVCHNVRERHVSRTVAPQVSAGSALDTPTIAARRSATALARRPCRVASTGEQPGP
ncbi:MAG: hypothetical protein J5I81_02745 [Nitrococcus mobilis]|nr:hypothetical protein [Nitrococcus mobilis]